MNGDIGKFSTPRGPIWLFGPAPSRRGPIVVAISGAFAPADAFDRLAGALPDLDVLRAHLPGNHCPLVDGHDPYAYADAFSHAVAALKRPVIVCGSSIGGVVALGLDAPNLAGVVALDPPLDNRACYPLWTPLRSRLPGTEPLRAFLWDTFGLDDASVARRDFSDLLDRSSAPATVILGDGPSRELGTLVSPEARRALASRSRVRVVSSAVGGHNLVREDPHLVLGELRRLVDGATAPA